LGKITIPHDMDREKKLKLLNNDSDDSYFSRHISRRNFLKKSAGFGASVYLMSMFNPFSTLSAASGEKSVRVGVFPTGNLTPGFMVTGTDAHIANTVYDKLVDYDPFTDDIRGMLAESWEVLNDGREWIFELRKGVRCHNGEEFTADDVLFTYNYWQEVGAPVKEDFSEVEELDKLDDYKVRFKLSSGDVLFHKKFIDYNAVMLVEDYDYMERGEREPLGTGPFKAKDMMPGERFVFEKNEDYWMEDQPYIDEVVFIIIPEESAQIAAMTTGEIEVIPSFEEKTMFDTFTQHPEVNVQSRSLAGHETAAMNVQNPPFDDNRVRKAMKYCLDRDGIETMLFEGMDISRGNDHPVAPIYEDYAEREPRRRNVERAKELLAEAGYPDGFDIELYFASNLYAPRNYALAIQEMARDIDVRVELQGFDRDIYLAEYWQNVDFCVTQWGHRPSPMTFFELAYVSDAVWPEGHYNNPELDQLVKEAKSEPDDEKRKETFREIQNLMVEDGPVLISYFHSMNFATQQHIEYHVTNNWHFDPRYIRKE